MLIRCIYCNWCGYQPSPAEYNTDTAYLQAVKEFEEHRDRNCCASDDAGK